MRTLVIETATPVLSVALFDGEAVLAADHRRIGRGHAELLVPAIAALPAGGRADRILVSCGPGSFTGIRIGIAAARALASAWRAELWGYDTLSLIGQHAHPGTDAVAVAIPGGHGELFVSEGGAPAQSLAPADAAAAIRARIIIGEAAQQIVERRGFGEARTGDADATLAMRLPQAALFTASPRYGRRPDAIAAGTAR